MEQELLELRVAVATLAEQLRIQNELLAAKDAQIAALTEKIAELTAKLDEKNHKKNSGNSSKPPSEDRLEKPAPKSLRGKSGKKKDLTEEIESYISVLELAGYKAQDSQLIAKSIKSGTTKANVLRNIRYLHLSWSMDECLRDPSITGILLSISFGKLKRLFPVTRHYHFNEKDFDRYVQNSDHWCFTYIELDHYIKPLLSCLSQEDRNKVFAEICIAGDRLVPAGEIANDLQKLMELNHAEEPEEFAKFLIDYGHDIFSKVSLFFTEFLDSMQERGIRSFSLISHAIQLHDTVLSVFEKENTEFEGTPTFRQHYLNIFFMPVIEKLTS